MIHRIKLGALAAVIASFSLSSLAAPFTPVLNEVIGNFKVTRVTSSPSTNTESFVLSPIKPGSPAVSIVNVRIGDLQRQLQMRYSGKKVSIPFNNIHCLPSPAKGEFICTIILPPGAAPR
jgi:hypothetical protein